MTAAFEAFRGWCPEPALFLLARFCNDSQRPHPGQVDYRVDSPKAGPDHNKHADPGSPMDDGNDFLPEKSAETSDDDLDADFRGPRKRQRTIPGPKSMQKITTSTPPASNVRISKGPFQGIDYYLKKSPNGQQWQAEPGSGPSQPAAAPQQRTLITVPTYRPQGSQPLVATYRMNHMQLRPKASVTTPPFLYYPQPATPQGLASKIPVVGGLAFQPQTQLKTLATQPSGLSQLVSSGNQAVTQQQQPQSALAANMPNRPAQTELILRGFNLLDRANFLKASTTPHCQWIASQ